MAKLEADFKGLVTAPGLLMRAPASFTQTTNALFPAPGLIQKRKGFERLAEGFGAPIFKLLTSRLMGDNVIGHYGASLTGGTDLRYGDGVTPAVPLTTVDAGPVTRPLDTKMQMAMQQRNHYVTADEGMRRIESDVGTGLVRYAGMPRGMSVALGNLWSVAPNLVAAGTLLPDGYARSYRVTWHRKDASGNELSGPPTARVPIRNQAGTPGYAAVASDTLCVIPIPKEFGTTATQLTDAYYWRLWGSRTWNAAAGDVGDDILWLVAQANVTLGDLAVGYANYTDATPDTYLVAAPTLNTNAFNFPDGEQGIQQGIVNADDPPPLANTVAQWQDVVWAADIAYRPRLQINLIANMVDGDTFNADGVTLTARLVPAGVTDFLIVPAGGGVTTEMGIEGTARNLAECINYNSTTLYAYYVSPPAGFGAVYLEQRQPSSPVLQVYSSAAFRPAITSATDLVADAQTNVIAFGKPLKGDSFPPINVLAAGPADSRIIRIEPFRDLLVLFTDYGIFKVTGRSFADFSVSPLDTTYRLISRDSVVVCDDRLYAWCFEGIIEIDSATNITVISTPIEPTIQTIRDNATDSTFAALAFSTAYRQRHRVLFWYPLGYSLTAVRGCGKWLVFDTRTRAWSDGVLPRIVDTGIEDSYSSVVVRFSDDRIIGGNWNPTDTDAYLFLERDTGTSADYVDTASDGFDTIVPLAATLQFQVPVADGAVHWQETLLHWDGGEFTGRPYPTTYLLFWATESGSGNIASTVTAPLPFARAEPPVEARRGNRMQLLVYHNTSEYCGVVGIAQAYSLATRFAR